MKKFAVVCSAVYALLVSADLWAQTRGPRYNPPSRSGGSSGSSSGSSRSSGSSSSPSRSSGSSSSGSSRGSSYNPPSRSSGSSSSGSSRGSSYNPPSRSSGSSSSGSSRGSSYNPPSRSSGSSTSSGSSSSGSSTSTPRGPRYNPDPGSNTGSTTSAPRGPRYNPNPTAPRYLPPRHQQPGHILVRREIYHVPRTVSGTYVVRHHVPRDYHILVNRRFIYRRWVQEPVVYWYTDGYWDIGGYPYYVYRGYRYRYNPVEMCQYELVDGNDYSVVKTYPVQACTVAYDNCAVERDTLNRTIGLERYFCAEAVDKDLEATETDYQASPIEMTDAKKAAIASYLDDMTFREIFDDGHETGVGSCSIEKVGGILGAGNPFNCKYQVNVGDKAFPLIDGSVCSDGDQAELVGCHVGNEKENAGCILQQAIEKGYCL